MHEKQALYAQDAPEAVGPYVPGVRAGAFVFTSGQIPLDPTTGALVEGDIAVQAERCLRNVEAVLRAGGASMDQVVKMTVFLTDMNDFAAVNEVYARHVQTAARSCVAVRALPKGARIEMEAVAFAPCCRHSEQGASC